MDETSTPGISTKSNFSLDYTSDTADQLECGKALSSSHQFLQDKCIHHLDKHLVSSVLASVKEKVKNLLQWFPTFLYAANC